MLDPWHGSPISPLTGKPMSYASMSPERKARALSPAAEELFSPKLMDEIAATLASAGSEKSKEDILRSASRLLAIQPGRASSGFSLRDRKAEEALTFEDVEASREARRKELAARNQAELREQIELKRLRDAREKRCSLLLSPQEAAYLESQAVEDERRKAVQAAHREEAKRLLVKAMKETEAERTFEHEWKVMEHKSVQDAIAEAKAAEAEERAARRASVLQLHNEREEQLRKVREERARAREEELAAAKAEYEARIALDEERHHARMSALEAQKAKYEANLKATQQIWTENQAKEDDLDTRILEQWRIKEMKDEADRVERLRQKHHRSLEQRRVLAEQIEAKRAREAERKRYDQEYAEEVMRQREADLEAIEADRRRVRERQGAQARALSRQLEALETPYGQFMS